MITRSLSRWHSRSSAWLGSILLLAGWNSYYYYYCTMYSILLYYLVVTKREPVFNLDQLAVKLKELLNGGSNPYQNLWA